MMHLDREVLARLLEAMRGRRVVILGDVMLDVYLLGTVSRISPEAPVPVVDVKEQRRALGGAANVANNIRVLGGEPLLVGVVGDDGAGRDLLVEMEGRGIPTRGLVVDGSRPTTIKTRVIAHSQQVVRIDQESIEEISDALHDKLMALVDEALGDSPVLLLQDYNKGVLTRRLIHEGIGLATRRGALVTVDPKLRNFFEYQGATLFKPNATEVERALGARLRGGGDSAEALRALRVKTGCRELLVTRGERGMSLVEEDGTVLEIPTVAREVYDVSGAGDTVIGAVTLAMAAGSPVRQAALLANYAASVEVTKRGVAAVSPVEILGAHDRCAR